MDKAGCDRINSLLINWISLFYWFFFFLATFDVCRIMKAKPLDKIEFSEIDDDSFIRYPPINTISIILLSIENYE